MIIDVFASIDSQA